MAINDTTLFRLLRKGSPEARCAAAIVLGEIGAREPRTAAVLTEALAETQNPVKAYCIAALARLRTREALLAILPFVTSEGTLREEAVAAVKTFGARALPELRRRVAREQGAARFPFYKILAAVPDRRAVDTLIGLLPGADPLHARAIVTAVGEGIGLWPRPLRHHLDSRARAFLRSKAAREDPGTAVAMIRFIAMTDRAAGVPELLGVVGPSHPAVVRRAALATLAGLGPAAVERSRIIARILPLVLDGDTEMEVPALQVLRAVSGTEIPEATLLSLTEAPGEEARAFGLRLLFRTRSQRALRLLMDRLRAPGRAERRGAREALQLSRPGQRLLIRAFVRSADPEDRRFLAEVLAESRMPAEWPSLRPVLEDYLRAVARGEDGSDHLTILGSLHREELNRRLLLRARALERAGDFEGMIRILQPLVRGRHAEAEPRFRLAVANLMSSPTLATGDPRHDRAMQILAPLIRTADFDLAAALEGDKRLSPAAFLAIAQHFARKAGPEADLAERAAARAGAVPPSNPPAATPAPPAPAP